MQLNLKKLFSLFFLVVFSLFLIGCAKIKIWPAEVGDKVFVQYTAVFDKYPDVIYDTTNPEISKKVKKTNTANVIWYEVFVIWNDNLIAQDIQNTVVWMKAWEMKSITLTPTQLNQSWYDDKNILSEPWFIYQKANIAITKWEIRYKNNQYIRVKSILWKGKTQKILFDMNSLDTYNDVTYSVKVLQVWWSELLESNK